MTQRIDVKLRSGRQHRDLRVFGSEFTASYASEGGTPRIKRTQHASEGAAKAEFEKILATRLKSTFELVGRSDDDVPLRANPHVEAHDDALESACLREPTTSGPWRVYADWLQSKGDVRVDIAALLQNGKAATAEALIVERDREALLGLMAGSVDIEIVGRRWEHGFLTGVSLRREMESKTVLALLTMSFLELPIARFVHALRFGLAGYESDDHDASCHRLGARRSNPFAQVQRLHPRRLRNFVDGVRRFRHRVGKAAQPRSAGNSRRPRAATPSVSSPPASGTMTMNALSRSLSKCAP